ncbi:prephenate dehydrogenase [Streptomyces agglomeratus]|uniref:Prephenate dehydrogenase n=1 Tax=Streptomyces agglomeratus TaxID=285458 RepID=A0A1E5P4E2_9ACTN|nr:prephenate dehydrogenase [Streptomyces agglomeratus]OEJ41649.1 prephenate dehydrogenase [Streptomyces agglomeratus]OEJ43972.1 prephenate dehydrogenase [Streptomyces agglomeratus]OEJ54140.1 prephenate dehydrogenase [Streptomyces agglomeratus]OEJ61512.1 prephenate dehydrogenase [Streptomyces agglomeratus]
MGTGLIGTSVALALSARGVTTHLIDRNPENVRIAAALGAGTAAPPGGPVDLAVVAVPPSDVARTVAEYQKRELARAYTDVASVKAAPYAQCAELGCDLTTLVGGHPMAGGERSGPLDARADLFTDRPWVFTPAVETSENTLNVALELASLCGAVPVVLDADDHDRAVALVSHLPHLLASLTGARLLDGEEYALRLAGRGMRDAVRTAGGDAGLWADILASNASAVGAVLAELSADLGRAAHALDRLAHGGPEQRGDAYEELTGLLRRGSEGRDRIAPSLGGGAGSYVWLSVAVDGPDRRAEHLLADVSTSRVGLERMVLPDESVHPDGPVGLLVARETAWPLSEALRDRGWAVQRGTAGAGPVPADGAGIAAGPARHAAAM